MTRAFSKPEYRKDPLSDSWVVISTERSARPEEFRELPVQRVDKPCPFCAGNERETPPPIACYPQEEWNFEESENRNEQWVVRVVPNKYPAVVPHESPCTAASFTNGTPQLFKTVTGSGCHELIIESREHAVSLTELAPETLDCMFQAYRDRMTAMHNAGWAYAQIFKNVGAAAGSSIEHAHSQVVGLPMVPVRVQEELTHARNYWDKYHRSLFQDIIAQELADGRRIVQESEHFVVLCPFASRSPFETWILPRQPAARLETASLEVMREFARCTQELVARLEHLFPHPAYNYLIHSAPFDGSADRYFQWHLELLPRLTKTAGFEWGTGYHINPVSPEQAAYHLRTISVNAVRSVQNV
jgi:UDPglucose--hexose-1-phosphate uridylyltransferase